jgi:hypothetical protein
MTGVINLVSCWRTISIADSIIKYIVSNTLCAGRVGSTSDTVNWARITGLIVYILVIASGTRDCTIRVII